ncbi:hypothetical protein [Limosilactobacillus reuteri]|uniref:hypothetical protein n=1 Tax=Limosilactobacillus reuteri TaxID=1598 RepID=UPI002AAA9B3A|nr:hypothetical protein [Limosilactobacillus reuteri]WPU43562.1 hypothetical protein SH603_00250 [Limosilactobacillus reuteri]
MEILTAKKLSVLNKLDRAGVECLQFDAYNEVEYSEKYQQEYIDLFEKIVVNRVFKHFNIDPQNNETIVNYFGKEDGKWFVSFYEPAVDTTIDKILKNDYSDLEELSHW